MPLLSVIIPVYNSKKFLNRCIDSVINQTFTDLELILVDDGSTDNSLEICKGYEKSDDRVKVIHKENGGAGPARNAGIAIARGKYLAFPDSDDRMDTHAYEECVKIMEKTDCDILVFGMKTEVFNDDSSTVEKTVEDNVPETFIDNSAEFHNKFGFLFGKMDLGSPCNKIYKRRIITEKQLCFPNLRRMQDCVFNLRYLDCITSFCSINKNYFIRTWHSSEFQRRKMPKDFLNCAITYFQTLTDNLKRWNVYGNENIVYFGDKFSETVMTAAFE